MKYFFRLILIAYTALFSLVANSEVIKGFPLSSVIWSDRSISVCWENLANSTDIERNWVKNAVNRTWSEVADLTFTGWGQCGNADIRIGVADIANNGPHVKALGSDLSGMRNGMVLNFTYLNWSPSCIGREQWCSEVIAIHEFGHALGYAHEHNRDDTPDTCLDAPQGSDGDTIIGEWDIDSVMNYCNPTFNGNGNLSSGDIRTTQVYYSEIFSGLENDLGSWVQSTDDSHNWSIRRGETPSSNTGPATAVVGDFYAYLETSSGNANSAGNTASIVSPLLPSADNQLSFDYHMFGSNIGTLSVDIYSEGTWHHDVWKKSGQQNNAQNEDWHRAEIDLGAFHGNIKARITATAIGGWQGDIAIDNLSIYQDTRIYDYNTISSLYYQFQINGNPYDSFLSVPTSGLESAINEHYFERNTAYIDTFEATWSKPNDAETIIEYRSDLYYWASGKQISSVGKWNPLMTVDRSRSSAVIPLTRNAAFPSFPSHTSKKKRVSYRYKLVDTRNGQEGPWVYTKPIWTLFDD